MHRGTKPLALLGIAHHDEAPGLQVESARSSQPCVQDLVQVSLMYRGGFESLGGPALLDDLAERLLCGGFGHGWSKKAVYTSVDLEHPSCYGTRGISTQASLRGDAGAAAEGGEERPAPLRGAEAPRLAPAFRFPAGDGRRAEVVGGSERSITRSR